MKKDYSQSQVGYFLGKRYWHDALKLLNFQILQKKNNRHYNTLSIFYYEQLDVDCTNAREEVYFESRIASSLFFALEKEFFVYHYVIPKQGLGLRDYVFFSYPMRALYYSVGLYLLKLSQEFLNEVHGKSKNIKSFYGGNLHFKNNDLVVTKSNIYYRNFYKRYREALEEEVKIEDQDNDKGKIILKLDIENYFGEISIQILLDNLDHYIKPSIKSEMNFDTFTKDQLSFFFHFLMNQNSGIPQSENNIISGFIGYLYLAFGDFILDNILASHRDFIDDYKILRYVDDICISITFKAGISIKSQGEFTLSVASEMAEALYSGLGLRLNLKTKAYHVYKEKDKSELLTRIRSFVSQDGGGFDYSDDFERDANDSKLKISPDKTPQEKLDEILSELRKLKKSNIEDYFIRSNSTSLSEDVFREIFNKGVYNLSGKPENLKKIRKIFSGFNFDLMKVSAFELMILILRDELSENCLKKFLLSKKLITTSDAELITKFLCQTGFRDEDKDLIEKLNENKLLENIVNSILSPDIKCSEPGYYSLTCFCLKKISDMPEVIDQMRLRVSNERSKSYSVALSHLLNEIHALCIRYESANKHEYNANDVFGYLSKVNIRHESRIKIRNLFDRRNSNGVSHPGTNTHTAWEVTKEEYFDYKKHVGYCFEQILNTYQ